MKEKLMVEAEYDEIETLVQQHLGINDYHFVAVQECGNDSAHTFTVEAEYDEEEWKAAEKRHFMYNNGMILNRLCFLGHLKPGDYVIKVCW